jgi:hypothetical protein
MRVFTIIFCLFLSVDALAQDNVARKTDSPTKSIYSDARDSVVYIVDGVPSSKDSVKPNEILIRNVLTGHQLDNLYVNKKLDSVIIIVTKVGAINSYQKKLSDFSVDYKNYLADHHNSDNRIIYCIDGDLFRGDEKRIKILYNLSANNIDKVSFLKSRDFEGIVTASLLITTKK